MKKYWHIWVGIGVILLAVLMVLGIVFLPRMAAKSDMKELLELASSSQAQYVMLIDPAYEHSGILAGYGREVMLDGTVLENIRAALVSATEDFSYAKKESTATGMFGLHLLIKTAEGDIVRIYFKQDLFYAELKGVAYYFRADDAQEYAALYSMLQDAF